MTSPKFKRFPSAGWMSETGRFQDLEIMNFLKKLLRKPEPPAAPLVSSGLFPPGHYHSTIPDPGDVAEGLKASAPVPGSLPGIDFHTGHQEALFLEFEKYYPDLPFPQNKTKDFRFYYENQFFSYSDAFFLFCFLRREKPRRIIEVGSGFSSALMLDTFDRYFTQKPEVTFIEPHTGRLKELLFENDLKACRLIEMPVQKVPLTEFESLKSGDLLFIDSSHVSKYGSDVNHLLFNVLPKLAPGVFVHFHDIFHAFEYPDRWLREGWYWNECYLLRAFLAFNREWNIYFFNNYIAQIFKERIRQTMPICDRVAGGSLYLRKAALTESAANDGGGDS